MMSSRSDSALECVQRLKQECRRLLRNAVADTRERPPARGRHQSGSPRCHLLVDGPRLFSRSDANRTADLREPAEGIAAFVASIDLFHRFEDRQQHGSFDLRRAEQSPPAVRKLLKA